MRKNYNYLVDGVQVKRDEFFKQLRHWSQTARRIDTIAGWCGIDLMEFDEKKYNRYMRDINRGTIVMIVHDRLTKTFQRKVA